ncbi:MAG: alpha/beta hydrolase [Mesorhizobium sp.]|nr:MAG: alpha/beta hydrolase [Mesorhizobium sp.]
MAVFAERNCDRRRHDVPFYRLSPRAHSSRYDRRSSTAGEPDLVRADRFVELRTGERLFVREVRRPGAASEANSAVLLVHGARVPGVASFDLPVAGGSLAADLAADGHLVYVLDVRGYGASSRPAAMNRPPDKSAPLMRTEDVVADISAAVDAIAKWSDVSRVSLVGWATGGHWAGAYASRFPQTVDRLILYNSLHGGSDQHSTLGTGSPLENPDRPGTFNVHTFGGYRMNTRQSLFTAWDDSIPVADKAQWRDPAVAAAYGDAALASDETAPTRQPPSFRSPSGAMADSFELAFGRRQWSAAALTMPVLVIRSGRDFWSRPEDAKTIVDEAPKAERLDIPDATHFVHLDREAAGRGVFLDAVKRFLDRQEERP